MGKSIKKLKHILKNHASRDNKGRITVHGRGGRHKRLYRIIDWSREDRNIKGTVIKVEYDPNRSTSIALIEYENKEVKYILRPKDLNVGDKVIAGEKAPIKPGSAMPLKNVPVGVEVHNIELIPGKGAKIVRSAGTSAVIIGKDEKYAHVKLPSNEIRKIDLESYATIGQLDNEDRKNRILGKAGKKRWLGRRPKVRGVAMHPGAHPHGGGEGRSGEGMHPKDRWGNPARGTKTRNKKKSSNKLIIKRRK
jgi:large subunit ribosomal protein L2